MLQRNGYEVSAANTGTQALTKAVTETPDLIILDVMMPDMNGYEVCRRLRMNVETKSIPIIMFTAKTLIDDKVAGFEAGADDYLTKPTHPAELSQRVKSLLGRTVQRRMTATHNPAIGVVGVKGGVGTTTLALNLAAARVLAGDNAIVADFRPGAGTIGLSLGFPSANSIANLLSKTVAEISPRAVEAELVAHSSGLRGLLSSSLARDTQMPYSSDQVVATVRALRQLGKPVFVDLGSGFTSLVSNLQREMDHIIVVSDTNPIALLMARDFLHELAQWSDVEGHDRMSLAVVNRAQASHLAGPEMERMVAHPIRGSVTYASELILQAIQARVPPVMYQPAAMFSTQVVKLADEIQLQAQEISRAAT
jgi:pilus assembly protein CpaE